MNAGICCPLRPQYDAKLAEDSLPEAEGRKALPRSRVDQASRKDNSVAGADFGGRRGILLWTL